MKNFRKLNREDGGVLIGILASIFGGFVRLYPDKIAGFPINDGGLFVVMIEAIKTNSLRLPTFFQYNNLNIPFAYPPFAFYVGAILSNLFHINPIDIVQWLPGIVLVGSVPAFYYLSKAIFNSSYQAGFATLAFAFTPRTFTWAVMGGGLTRSFGLLFLLLSLGSIYRLFKERNRKHLFTSILFSALVVLAHPEAMVHTITFALLFWLFVGRNKPGTINALLIAIGTTLVTSIWWLPTILRLGLSPFLAAAQTGSQNAFSVIYPFLLTLTDEPYLTIVAVLGLIGLFVCIVNKYYLFPVWYFVPYFVDPRSAATYSMIPLSFMAGLALSELIFPGMASLGNSNKPTTQSNAFQSPLAITMLIFTGIYMLGGTIYFGTQLAGSALSGADRTAFNWIKENTQPGSLFLVMTGEGQILCDSIQEWFPVLTDRVSITTIQGNEWLPNHKYAQSIALQNGIQSCIEDPSPLNCVEKYHLQYEYIYVSKRGSIKNSCRVVATISRGDYLISELNENNNYQRAYQSNSVTIFSVLH